MAHRNIMGPRLPPELEENILARGIGPQLPPHPQILQDNEDINQDTRSTSPHRNSDYDSPDDSMTYGPVLPNFKESTICRTRTESTDHTKSCDNNSNTNMAAETYGPALPTQTNSANKPDVYGPALPISVCRKDDKQMPMESEHDQIKITHRNIDDQSFGPALPPSLPQLPQASNNDTSDDSDVEFGPKMADINTSQVHSSTIEEIERRSIIMHSRLTGASMGDEQLVREEWMTELPPALGKSIGLGLAARTFRKKAAETGGDRSEWTDTPADRERKHKEGHSSHKKQCIDDVFGKQKDDECADIISKHNKEKRKDSLLDMHKKKRKKDKKEKERKEKKKSHKDKREDKVRRPFDRDEDLKVNRFDEAQRNAVIKKSRDLDTRFNTGKYL